jgi:hypothetical protein
MQNDSQFFSPVILTVSQPIHSWFIRMVEFDPLVDLVMAIPEV